MSLFERWKRMERREAIGQSIGLAGILLLVFWLEVDGFGLAYVDFGLTFSTNWIVMAIGFGLIGMGTWISPPANWRWGKIPVQVKDPTHELSMPEKSSLPERIVDLPRRRKS